MKKEANFFIKIAIFNQFSTGQMTQFSIYSRFNHLKHSFPSLSHSTSEGHLSAKSIESTLAFVQSKCGGKICFPGI